MKKALVSAIITTKNSADTMEELLKSLKKQTYKNIEIIVVDNNSKDKTVDISKKYTKLVFNKGPERSAQRNYGVKKSKGKYLLILDSDMILTKKVVKECVDKIENKKVKIGEVVIPEKSFGIGFWAKAKAFERKINEGQNYFEAARFFTKKIFNEFKGYDTKLTGPEDWELPQRIAKKYKMERIRSYILHNEGHPTLYKLAKRKYYYGLSVDKYLKKQNINVVSPRTVYFLRPAFYKNWKLLIKKPILTSGMFFMLFVESFGGLLGYLKGKTQNA